LKNNDLMKMLNEFNRFSFFNSAKYLLKNGICDYKTLRIELNQLGQSNEK